MLLVFAVLIGLVPVIPAVVYVIQNGNLKPSQAISRMVSGFNWFNFLVGLMAGGLALVWLASPSAVLAGRPPRMPPWWISTPRSPQPCQQVWPVSALVLPWLPPVPPPSVPLRRNPSRSDAP